MKTILLLLFSVNCFCQPLHATWTKNGAPVYYLYESPDTSHWKLINTLSDTDCIIPTNTGWYVVTGNGVTSNAVLFIAPTVSIINANLISNKTSVTISWTSQNENNQAWEIDSSLTGKVFTMVSKFSPKGNSTYQVTVNRKSTTKITGWGWWKKTTVTYDSRKYFYEIISIDFNGGRTILKTLDG